MSKGQDRTCSLTTKNLPNSRNANLRGAGDGQTRVKVDRISVCTVIGDY